MTTHIGTSNATALNSRSNTHQRRLLLLACLFGIVVGILFILVQPLFGMDTLTSRHAALYQQLGGWSATPALVIAWFAHLMVSVSYGLMSAMVVTTDFRLATGALFTLGFAWLTTVIAPPANAIIVQLVSFQHVVAGDLPGLNFNLDEKFLLHLAFFASITSGLYIYKASKSKLS